MHKQGAEMIYNEFSVTAAPWSRYMRTRLSGFSILIFGAILSVAVSAGAADKPKPLTPDSPEVKRVVLAKLREPTPEDFEQVKRIIRAMAGKDEKKRDDAIKEFIADYAWYRDRLGLTSFQEFGLSKEEVNKGQEIFSGSEELAETNRKFGRATKLVKSKGLLDQPDYLIALLNETKGRDKAAVAKRLQKVTRQTFGQDAPAWKKWWSEQKSWGKFEQVAPEVENLIRFKVVEKSLRLDRNHWAEVAKKTDKEQLRKQYLMICYDKRHRTKKWALKWARDAVEGPDSRLVFTRLALAAEEGSVGFRSSGKTGFSSQFGNSGGTFEGVFSRQDETVRITLEERSGPRRRLEVWDSGTGAMRIMLTSLTDGSVLTIRQRHNGNFSVDQADAGGSVSFREDSFVSFCRKHRRYADKRVFSRLRRLGIGLPPLPKASDTASAKGRPAVPPADSGKAEWKRGLLQEIPDDVGRLIGLTVSRKRLILDRAHWRRVLKGQDLEELRAKQRGLGMSKFFDEKYFRSRQGWTKEHLELARECGFAMRLFQQACAQKWYRGGGGGGMGFGDRMTMNFSIVNELRAQLTIQKDRVHIVLVERKGPSRKIEVYDDGRRAMRILVMREDGTAVLLINQAANGRFAVADAMGERFFVAGAESFKAFSHKYRRYVNERLFGYLKHLGILTPPDPYSKAVRDVVVLRLTGLSEQETRRAWHLISQLDDIQYHKQEAAARILTERLNHYHEVLKEATRSKSLSTGAKTRIKQIFVEALEADRIKQAIDGRGLLDDVDYLIKLMGKTKGQARKAVENRLKKITGKDLGEDTKTWQEWWSKKQAEQSD
jgi:hypothetical protein